MATKSAEISLYTVPLARSNELLRTMAVSRKYHHWAIRVHDFTYEVCTIGQDADGKNEYDMRKMRALHWLSLKSRAGLEVRRKKLGLTNWSDPEVHEYARRIWNLYFGQSYWADNRNCQKFARLLVSKILAPKRNFDKVEQQTWNRFPLEYGIGTEICELSAVAGLVGGILACASVVGLPVGIGMLAGGAWSGIVPLITQKGGNLLLRRKVKKLDKTFEKDKRLPREQAAIKAVHLSTDWKNDTYKDDGLAYNGKRLIAAYYLCPIDEMPPNCEWLAADYAAPEGQMRSIS